MKTGRIVRSHNETGMRILVAEDDLRLQRSLVKALGETDPGAVTRTATRD